MMMRMKLSALAPTTKRCLVGTWGRYFGGGGGMGRGVASLSAATTTVTASTTTTSTPPTPSTTTNTTLRTHYTYQHGPGSYQTSTDALHELWKQRDFTHRGFTVGIGGPVGSGKTATVWKLCQSLRHNSQVGNNNLGVVTNDIFTQEDAQFLTRQQALPADCIRAVETGGCPHAAIREDVSANLTALEELTAHLLSKQQQQQPQPPSAMTTMPPPLLLCESGGDNLAANFSRELADLTVYVIDVAGGDKVPRKGGPGITQSDMFIINKIDLATAVGADLDVMRHDAQHMRGDAPTLFCSIKHGQGVDELQDFILQHYTWAMEHCVPNVGAGQEKAV